MKYQTCEVCKVRYSGNFLRCIHCLTATRDELIEYDPIQEANYFQEADQN